MTMINMTTVVVFIVGLDSVACIGFWDFASYQELFNHLGFRPLE